MKTAIIVFITGGLMFWAWVTCRLTHIVDIYRIPSTSSEPTYHSGSILVASRLKQPDRNAFVCFKKVDKKDIFIYRCIGKEGDIIEIKDAVVYLNGKRLDEPYTWNEYYISQKQLTTIQGYVDKYNYTLQPINDSLYSISLAATDLKHYHLDLKPFTMEKGITDTSLFKDFRKYNVDNLGPIKVPSNSYFLMGDNRSESCDSRNYGPVERDQINRVVKLPENSPRPGFCEIMLSETGKVTPVTDQSAA